MDAIFRGLFFGKLEAILLVFHKDIGWITCFLKKVVTVFQIFPEGVPPGFPVLLHIVARHAKGENMNAKEGLSVTQGRMRQSVDLLNSLVRHSETPDGYIASVNHNETARSSKSSVIKVGVTEIE
jgi:hypothetical protein